MNVKKQGNLDIWKGGAGRWGVQQLPPHIKTAKAASISKSSLSLPPFPPHRTNIITAITNFSHNQLDHQLLTIMSGGGSEAGQSDQENNQSTAPPLDDSHLSGAKEEVDLLGKRRKQGVDGRIPLSFLSEPF